MGLPMPAPHVDYMYTLFVTNQGYAGITLIYSQGLGGVSSAVHGQGYVHACRRDVDDSWRCGEGWQKRSERLSVDGSESSVSWRDQAGIPRQYKQPHTTTHST